MTEVSSNFSWDMLDTKEKVSMLQKLNSNMPTQLIEELVMMYDSMDEEQKKQMEENIDKVKIEKERVPDELPDAVSIFNFDSVDESDEFLVKEGKVKPEDLEKNKIFEISEDYEYDSKDLEKNKVWEIPEDYEYDSKDFESFLKNNK